MSLGEELAFLIEQAGVDSPPPDGGLLINQRVESPDALTVIYETPGSAGLGIRTQDVPGQKYVLETAQILVRDSASRQQEARARIRSIYDVMNGGVRNDSILGIYYLSVDASQPPFFLERDGNDRWMFAFNVQALKEPS